jgi:hypothetical protein
MVTRTRRLAGWAVFAAIMALADVLLATWWVGSAWGMAVCVVAIAGLIAVAPWALRPPRPR